MMGDVLGAVRAKNGATSPCYLLHPGFILGYLCIHMSDMFRWSVSMEECHVFPFGALPLDALVPTPNTSRLSLSRHTVSTLSFSNNRRSLIDAQRQESCPMTVKVPHVSQTSGRIKKASKTSRSSGEPIRSGFCVRLFSFFLLSATGATAFLSVTTTSKSIKDSQRNKLNHTTVPTRTSVYKRTTHSREDGT